MVFLVHAVSLALVAGQTTQCQKPDGTKGPCGPGNDLCHSPGYPSAGAAPQYHVRDSSCAMNDPAAVIFDPKHGVYHDHWEDHLARPGGGYTRGHAVSRDFTHWAHMPVSLWNDRPYDAYAIFTGSATLVDTQVVQVYPGLCNNPKPGTPCPGGTNLAIAVPADPTDPLQTNWTKDGVLGGGLTGYVNPIVNNTQRDPSTAWRTPSGEWRLTTFDTTIYGSMDFKSWYTIGAQKDFPGGECPSLFPLPNATPGAGPAPAGAGTPTHVHKASHGRKDWMTVGTYTPGAPKVLGSFVATAGVPFTSALIDSGNFYASKDFYDPVKQRRISWGWAQIAYGPWNTGRSWDSSCHTLPREVTWNPELQQLVFSPVEEQVSLRGAVLGQLKPQELPAGAPVSLGLAKQGGGNQSEIVVVFKRPTAAAVGNGTGKATLSVTVVDNSKVVAAFEVVFVDAGCSAGTKGVCTVKVNGEPLKLSPNDATIDVRIFIDNVLIEGYVMSGRMAHTQAALCGERCDITVASDTAGVMLVSATAWAVGSPWVTPAEVLQTLRVDNGDVDLMAARIDAQQSGMQ